MVEEINLLVLADKDLKDEADREYWPVKKLISAGTGFGEYILFLFGQDGLLGHYDFP